MNLKRIQFLLTWFKIAIKIIPINLKGINCNDWLQQTRLYTKCGHQNKFKSKRSILSKFLVAFVLCTFPELKDGKIKSKNIKYKNN